MLQLFICRIFEIWVLICFSLSVCYGSQFKQVLVLVFVFFGGLQHETFVLDYISGRLVFADEAVSPEDKFIAFLIFFICCVSL